MKKIILLALATLMMVGCEYRNPDGSYDTSRSINFETIEIDSCEYISGFYMFAHKGNCRFCEERDSIKWEKRKKELKDIIEQLKEIIIMKELTIEEKAKRYDKAIIEFKPIYDLAKEQGRTVDVQEFESIFPELVESEDEKNIKDLIDELKLSLRAANCQNDACGGGHEKRIALLEWGIAWLEKQSEQNLTDKVKPKFKVGDTIVEKDFDECGYGTIKDIKDGQYIFTDGSWMNIDEQGGWQLVKTSINIEQKPANKVIEEEKPLLEKFKQAVYDCAWGKVTCKVEGESQEEYANRWAEHLLILVRDWADDYIDNKEDAIARRAYDKGKQDIQKPAWSEEDYNEIETIACHLDNIDNEGMAEVLRNIRDKYYHIFPQTTWKPSDEQMEALKGVQEGVFRLGILESLYQDLKKLKS